LSSSLRMGSVSEQAKIVSPARVESRKDRSGDRTEKGYFGTFKFALLDFS
jgi:hypothetical protein